MMRKFVLLSVFLYSVMVCMAQLASVDYRSLNIDAEKCYWVWSNRVPNEFIHLQGKVYVAKEGEPYDLKIRKVGEREHPDMRVGIVKKYPDECGLWQWTNDRKEASFVIKFVTKPGTEHLAVHFVDGEKVRHNMNLPCWDYSSGTRKPCR